MRWALMVVGMAFACVAAPPVAMGQLLSMCMLNAPRDESCLIPSPALAGAACTCIAGGIALPGHIVAVPTRGAGPVAPPPVAREAPNRSTPAVVIPPVVPTRPLQPARALRLGPTIPDAGVGAYGVVALTAKATPDTQDRLDRFCRAFLASLPPQSNLPATVPLADQMLTYWPVTTQSAEQCDRLLGNYDLFVGQQAIRDAAAHHSDVSDRGPYLIGWSPSASRGVPDAIVLVLDLSNLESERSFTDAFQFWQERVVQDPSLWRNGFSVFLVRRAARDFADRYGSDILKALHLSNE